MSDRRSQLDRISPDEDKRSGGGGVGVSVLAVALGAGFLMIFGLLKLIDSLTTGDIPIGILGAGAVFVGFVGLFWAYSRMQTSM